MKLQHLVDEAMPVFNLLRHLTSWIKEALIAKALPVLEVIIFDQEFVHSEKSFQNGELLLRMKQAFVKFWEDIQVEMTAIRRPYLILARLSQDWSKGVIESIFSMYHQRMFVSTIYIAGLSDTEITKSGLDISSAFSDLSQVGSSE